MEYRRITQMTLIIAMLLSGLVPAQGNLVDPYEILDNYFNASGGLSLMKAEKSQYVEGELAVGGLKGALKAWSMKPSYSLTIVDLGILQMTQGDNGEYQWILDSNNKLQKITKFDEAALKRKEVKRRISDYEYADRNSTVFRVLFEGKAEVEDQACYVVKITNNINKDVLTFYINIENFYLEKSISLEGDNSNDTYYKDYRVVDGLLVAFQNRQIAHASGQVQEVALTKYESNPAIEPSFFDAPAAGQKDYQFTQGDRAEDIPIRFEDNHIYIPVIADCKERYWILDTGASVSVIDAGFAESLGLELQGEMKGKGAGGPVDVKFTALPGFDLKGIHFGEQKLAAIDLAELNKLLGLEIVGILGYDFLSRFVTKIDFAKERLSLYDPETFHYEGEGHAVDMHLKNGVFVVHASLDSRHSGTWLFDIGASTTSLDGVFALKTGYADKSGVETMARGAGNSFVTKKIKCSQLDFAGFVLDRPIISFAYGGKDTVSTSDDIGILGNTLFRNFVLYCDYANERLILEKGDNFNRDFPEDRSGLQIMRAEADNYEVLHVAKNTPAARAGFQAGDKLLRINGIDINNFGGLISIRRMLRDEPGTQYNFAVVRQGKEKNLKLRLADLY